MSKLKSEAEPANEPAIREGILGALGVYLAETPLPHVVGETGIISVNLQVFLEKGLARWAKGGVSFERRINLGGAS